MCSNFSCRLQSISTWLDMCWSIYINKTKKHLLDRKGVTIKQTFFQNQLVTDRQWRKDTCQMKGLYLQYNTLLITMEPVEMNLFTLYLHFAVVIVALIKAINSQL